MHCQIKAIAKLALCKLKYLCQFVKQISLVLQGKPAKKRVIEQLLENVNTLTQLCVKVAAFCNKTLA